MRAFTSFIVVLVVVGALGYGGLTYLRENADAFKEGSLPARVGKDLRPSPPPVPPASGPRDYHLLEAQGGIQRDQAEAAGLSTEKWAYLQALTPVQQTPGVEAAGPVLVRDLSYEFCVQFNSTAAQDQHLEYQLSGKWDELHFGFGFSDLEPSDPTNRLAIELTISLDGKPAFGPKRVTPVDKPLFSRLDVSGVNRVMFTSRRIGMGNKFAPVLLDPFVKLEEPAGLPDTATAAAEPVSNN